MSYATLMAYIEFDDIPRDQVSLAADLRNKLKATLIGLCALAIRPLFLDEKFKTRRVTAADVENMKFKIASKGDWFQRLAQTEHGAVEWRPILDFPIDALAREARCADLVIIGRTRSLGDAYSSLDPGAALLRIGRPILLVPDGVSLLRADRVLVGWKDTREARRAVRDALPFLRTARHVTIVEICQAGEEDSAAGHINDVTHYLARHGISGGPRVILDRDVSGAQQLTNLAQEEGADLLVVGAYGHSRLGEWFFGGVTRDLLATSPICCLMSH